MQVRLIDLDAFDFATPRELPALAAAVDETCRETGFLQVTGHGVPDSVIAEMRAAARAFFDLPAEDKAAVAPAPGGPYGYLGFGAEALARSQGEDGPPDRKESFNGGPLEVPEDETDPDALAFCYAPTPMPGLPGFERAWTTYYQTMEELAARIMEVMALALGREREFFAPFIDRPISALRALNYPAAEGALDPGQLGAGAHTDYGSLTILLPDRGSRGLEIEGPDGRWTEVVPRDGAFVVNIGDLMAHWTGGRWRSTRHRVRPTPRRRGALAFFHQPNWHARVAPLDGGGETVISGPYLMAKFAATTA